MPTFFILHTEDTELNNLIQAADRVHRIGQTNNVTVYNLVAEGTCEEDMAHMIMAKAEVANAVMDGGANTELATMMNLGNAR